MGISSTWTSTSVCYMPRRFLFSLVTNPPFMFSPLGTGAAGLGCSTVELWVVMVCNWGGGGPGGAAVLKADVGLEWGWNPQQLQSHLFSPFLGG